jgi:hypothetical protein
MTNLRYQPQKIKSSEKIFLPDHPSSDKQGFICIDHPGLLNELTSNIQQNIKKKQSTLQRTAELFVSNKTSDKY